MVVCGAGAIEHTKLVSVAIHHIHHHNLPFISSNLRVNQSSFIHWYHVDGLVMGCRWKWHKSILVRVHHYHHQVNQ
jgi:hypothetical protein